MIQLLLPKLLQRGLRHAQIARALRINITALRKFFAETLACVSALRPVSTPKAKKPDVLRDEWGRRILRPLDTTKHIKLEVYCNDGEPNADY